METIKMKPDQFIGFMERVSEQIRPQSIINTLSCLDKQEVAYMYKVHINKIDLRTVEYWSDIAFDNKDIKIVYEDRGVHEEIFNNVIELSVTVRANTDSAVNNYGVPCFCTTFDNWFSVKSGPDDISDLTLEGKRGMLTKVEIL